MDGFRKFDVYLATKILVNIRRALTSLYYIVYLHSIDKSLTMKIISRFIFQECYALKNCIGCAHLTTKNIKLNIIYIYNIAASICYQINLLNFIGGTKRVLKNCITIT